MKIAILGYSGSGKSTLARRLSEKYNVPVLHFDTVQFLPDWEIRSEDEKRRLTQSFLDANTDWIIDGNYSKLFYARRIEEADEIILLLFGRFACLYRAFRRYLKHKNTVRPDMAEGCKEKFDLEFARWILWEGRSKSARARYRSLLETHREKVVLIRNQKQLDAYLTKINAE